jgi:hypothetical protein
MIWNKSIKEYLIAISHEIIIFLFHYKNNVIHSDRNKGHYGHITGLTKPAKVGKILDLYRLKSLSLDCKAKVTLSWHSCLLDLGFNFHLEFRQYKLK